jgi:hypothetical protein
MSKGADYHDRVLTGLQQAAERSRIESDPEVAVSHFTAATRAVLGDPDAPSRPGALKPGEEHFVSSACFFIAPDRRHMILCATHGFPPEQRHARISVTDSRPGHTVQTATPAVVPNTDEDPIFRQIQANGRVGCSVYVPVMWQGEVIGMFNTAAKARYMFDETDLRMQMLFANCAAATWIALGGKEYIAGVVAALGPWTET